MPLIGGDQCVSGLDHFGVDLESGAATVAFPVRLELPD